VKLRPGDGSRDLRNKRPRHGENAHPKSENEEREQADALARVVQPGRRGNFKKRGEISGRGVGRERQQRNDAVERSGSRVKESQG